MKEKELDMNDLIRDFNEYSTDYNKTTCEYYKDYLTNYQKEKKRLETNWKELKKWLEYKAEQMDEFDIPKRKETGAFWYSTRGEIQGFLDKMQEIESGNDE